MSESSGRGIRSWTKQADGILVGPPDAPDEVIDVEHYNRAMDALTNADARVTELETAIQEPVAILSAMVNAHDWPTFSSPAMRRRIEAAERGLRAVLKGEVTAQA